MITSIEAKEVSVPPSSRLRQMDELYNSGRPSLQPIDPDYEMAVEGERDIGLLEFSFDQLSEFQMSEAFRDLLQKLVRDSVLPQRDRGNSPGRDAAFEIYVATVCTSAGLLPVTFEEPDVICTFDGTKYGFAAKRLKNFNNLRRRISDACDQIDRSGISGVIALDLCLAFNPNNERIGQMSESQFWTEFQKKLLNAWARFQQKVQEKIACHQVLGIIVHDYSIRQQNNDWQLAGATLRVRAEAQTPEEQQLFETLSNQYVMGLPNQKRV